MVMKFDRANRNRHAREIRQS